jgi:hypothetical protein
MYQNAAKFCKKRAGIAHFRPFSPTNPNEKRTDSVPNSQKAKIQPTFLTSDPFGTLSAT